MPIEDKLIIRNTTKMTLLFILIIILSYFFLDRPIAEYFYRESLSEKKVLTLFSYAISPIANLVCWPALFFLIRMIYKKEILGNRILFISLSIACSNLAASFVKIVLGRARPEMFFLHQIYGFQFLGTTNLDFSFPSGHACTVGAILASFACFFPTRFFYFSLLAVGLSFIRVMQNHHFLSDILAGAAIGFIIAPFVFFQMKKAHYQFSC